ncbi:Cytochrome c family protein [hydrothermal vent metagenome]|uniref:Cytochrome c family protein n=1 Tax=hydrothermal vent metagenome TaxID=652676 RepID=A0A1W1C6C2_9ZZZZ
MKIIILIYLGLISVFVSANTGEQLYKNNCLQCHGSKQQGGIGLPLKLAVIKNLSNNYIKRTILLGRPNRIMPKFYFNNQQIQSIIKYLRQGTKEPIYKKNIKGNSKLGKIVYKNKCAKCHADDLSGGQGSGVIQVVKKDKKVVPPAIGNQGFLQSATKEMIYHIITNGIDGSDMKSAKKMSMSEEDVRNVAEYVSNYKEKKVAENFSEEYTLEFDSAYNFKETIENLEGSIVGHNFRLYKKRYLLQDLGEVNTKQVMLRFCNFLVLYKLLKIEPRLGVLLPCRVYVIEQDDGSVKVLVKNYRKYIALFNNKQLFERTKELLDQFEEIIEDALL